MISNGNPKVSVGMRTSWNGLRSRLEQWLLRRAGTRGALTAGVDNINKGNYATAAQAFADAERLYMEQGASSHRLAEAIAYRAWCYTKLNRAIEAIPLYEHALELETQSQAKPDRIAQLREQLDWAKAKSVGAG
jgi:tetratricopeptide (TPR) repeat protein